MIEKLKTPKYINWDDTPEAMLERHWIISDVYEKINELVDVVNELQLTVSKMENLEHLRKIGQGLKNPADPYVEQRRWIGKLCKFWDDNFKITKHFGILTRIDETAIVKYEAENGFWYCACEPVKPDDNIIYKGGGNVSE